MHASILKNASRVQVSGSKLTHLAQIIAKDRQPKKLDESMSSPLDALSLSVSRSSTPESFSLSVPPSTYSTRPFSAKEQQDSRLDDESTLRQPSEAPSPHSSYSQPRSLDSRSSTPLSHQSFDSLESSKYREELQKLEMKLALLHEEKQMVFQQLKDLLAVTLATPATTAAASTLATTITTTATKTTAAVYRDDAKHEPAIQSPTLAGASTTAPFVPIVGRLPAKSGPSFGQPLESELSDANDDEDNNEKEEEVRLHTALTVAVSIPTAAGAEPLARALPLSAPAILSPSMQGAPMLELTKRPLALESVIEDLQPHKLQRVEV